eukprot:TRINITY_DN32392_c0_g1_i1.p1 TRINITY_DN32392_c0_g1~~TRINITY_DN32392_c0_g1_i1.p1  ORF type:complete len:266 (+),score=24.99 TRINITY_DN32392_c0_g1_i1:99-896(+)
MATAHLSVARTVFLRAETRQNESSQSTIIRASLAPASQRSLACSRSEVVGRCISFSAAAAPASTSNYRRFSVFAAKRVQSGRSLVLSSSLEVIPGKEDAAQALCKSIGSWVEEQKKDPKKGILLFECSGDAYEKNVIHFWERYDSFLSMNGIHAAPEYTKFLEEIRPLLEAPVQLAAYEYKDGQIGCMLNPIGPKGEGGLDDATGQGGSGGGASYKQTSQSVMQGISERDAWGIEKALDISGARSAAELAKEAIAKSLKSLFGQK